MVAQTRTQVCTLTELEVPNWWISNPPTMKWNVFFSGFEVVHRKKKNKTGKTNIISSETSSVFTFFMTRRRLGQRRLNYLSV